MGGLSFCRSVICFLAGVSFRFLFVVLNSLAHVQSFFFPLFTCILSISNHTLLMLLHGPSLSYFIRSFHFGIYLLFIPTHRWMLISYEQDKVINLVL